MHFTLSTLKKLFVYFSIATVGLALLGHAQAAPNFIVISVDDMNADDFAHMAHAQSLLVAQGASFTQSFVTDSVCCPSRVSLLRGQYTHNHNVLTNAGEGGGFLTMFMLGLENSTLATWLQSAGYITSLMGKYVNGYPLLDDQTYVPPGWSDWHAFLQGKNYYEYKVNNNGVLTRYGTDAASYSTDVLRDLALNFLNVQTATTPFFLYIAPHAPHDPQTPAPRHLDLFPDLIYPKKPSFDEADVSDKAAWIQERPNLDSRVVIQTDINHRNRIRSLQAVDEMIRDLVDKLTTANLLSNTYIIFTSDNGVSQGEHRLRSKGLPYEETIRVPFVVRGPSVAANVQREHFMLNIDIAPTIAKLAGVAIPTFVDGRSLAGVIAGKTLPAVEQTEKFVVERVVPLTGNALTVPAYAALRTRQYTYVEYEGGEIELYDLAADPYQIDSIHATASQSLLDDLAGSLSSLKTCVGTTACRPRVP